MEHLREDNNSYLRIMRTARTLFGAKGFHSTSMAELAVKSGVSVGQIYRHFSSKDDLIVAIALDEAKKDVEALSVIAETAKINSFTFFRALEQFAQVLIIKADNNLAIEILAESRRNMRVEQVARRVAGEYEIHMRLLVERTKPELAASELDNVARALSVLLEAFALQLSPAVPKCDKDGCLP